MLMMLSSKKLAPLEVMDNPVRPDLPLIKILLFFITEYGELEYIFIPVKVA